MDSSCQQQSLINKYVNISKEMEEIAEYVQQLKNLVSLRYIDPIMRSKCFNLFNSSQCELMICQDYIIKIEEEHDKMMREVSNFLSILTPIMNDHSHQMQVTHQEIIENNKIHELQIKQMSSQHSQLQDKIQSLNQEILQKEQLISELGVKIDEKDAFIEQRQKEEHQYLSKIQADFSKQQKILEESAFTLSKKEQQINILKEEIFHLQESKRSSRVKNKQNSSENRDLYKQIHLKSKDQQKSDDSYTIVQGSLVNSQKRSEGLSQFQAIRVIQQQDSRENIEDQYPRGQTLRQMLNLSYQKQFKSKYNKFDSAHYQLSKQNDAKGWNRYQKSKSDQKKPNWIINQSCQLIRYDEKKVPIKQFKLGTFPILKENNPYYLYFVIACQNVKIRSQYFEEMSQIDAQPQWIYLNTQRIPLHQWQSNIQSFLMKEAKIIKE